MTAPYAPVARQAAARLAATFDPNLPALTERALAVGDEEGKPVQYDPATIAISLAALIVSVAKLAWDIHRDLEKDAKDSTPPRPDVLVRRIRVKVGEVPHMPVATRDQVIQVVVEEQLAQDR